MKTKILGVALVFSGILLFAGIVNASTAEIIQPASIVYNENMTVNGSLQVGSLRVGYEGVGGVTYFNGTIINVGPQIPVTIGDDLRIDGEIWRGPSKGQADGQPLKFSDSLTPTDTNAFNLGFDDKRWKDLYLAGYLYGEDFMVGREIWGGTKKGIIDGDDPLFVSDSIYPTKDDINNLGSNKNRWKDLYLSGMLQGVDAKFTGNVDFSGATVTGLTVGDYYTKSESDSKYYINETHTRYWTATGIAFRGEDEVCDLTQHVTNGQVWTTSCNSLLATVNLPDGAVVSEVQMKGQDIDATNDFTVWLYRSGMDSTSQIMAETKTSGSDTSIKTYTDDTIDSATIDNQNNGYFLRAYALNIGGSDHRLFGVRIKYTIDKPLP